MRIDIDRSLFPPEDPPKLTPQQRIDELCWLAREILGAYMQPPSHIATAGDTDEDEADDEETLEGIFHDTETIPINPRQNAYLSNLAHIAIGDALVHWPVRGFVTLQIESAIDHELADTEAMPVEALPDLYDQYIFRVPTNESEGVIYHGFAFSPNLEVREVSALKNLSFALQCIRRALRARLVNDPEAHDQTYLSRTPHPPVAEAFAELLQGE